MWLVCIKYQWQIQDLPVFGNNLLFGKIFAENCMKMKEIELRVGVAHVPTGSANEYNNIFNFIPISLDVKKFYHHNSLVSN